MEEEEGLTKETSLKVIREVGVRDVLGEGH